MTVYEAARPRHPHGTNLRGPGSLPGREHRSTSHGPGGSFAIPARDPQALIPRRRAPPTHPALSSAWWGGARLGDVSIPGCWRLFPGTGERLSPGEGGYLRPCLMPHPRRTRRGTYVLPRAWGRLRVWRSRSRKGLEACSVGRGSVKDGVPHRTGGPVRCGTPSPAGRLSARGPAALNDRAPAGLSAERPAEGTACQHLQR